MKSIRRKLSALVLAFFICSFTINISGCGEEELDHIPEEAALNGGFETLLVALQASGRDVTLRQQGPYTFFAPVDGVFEALPPQLVEQLLLAVPVLRAILDYHIVYGEYTAEDLAGMSGETLTTLFGQKLQVSVQGGAVFVNDAPVVLADVPARNGVIHGIGGLLIPNVPEIQALLQ
ncbi:MAG: fasciclin domain-containing protein [Deltaproteobacteria bacterium]|nr:fasciclin domain-containing protein [Deltaproteobacteria bacterium]